MFFFPFEREENVFSFFGRGGGWPLIFVDHNLKHFEFETNHYFNVVRKGCHVA